MINQIDSGSYVLGESKNHTKILTLNDQSYAWILMPGVGDILSFLSEQKTPYATLSTGNFKLYDIQDEPELVDLQHLELQTGMDSWQGFLLLTGLPNKVKKRSRIIPTKELVETAHHSFRQMVDAQYNLATGVA
ncbi:TPA: hypothetical protein EYO12_01140 [Candidatus Saccharibacteria bacterium]|nr:hypothetical protein [Candidatus Saccharibacteria bacterium]HIO87323.1 hypothetical protein [Candidatus Saccharibacteria bacterium]